MQADEPKWVDTNERGRNGNGPYVALKSGQMGSTSKSAVQMKWTEMLGLMVMTQEVI